MKKLLHVGLLLCLAMTGAAQMRQPQKFLHEFDWKNLAQNFPNSQIVSMDGISVLKIEKTNDTPLEISLLTITNSSLIQRANTIEWEMKYDKVYPSQPGWFRAGQEISPPPPEPGPTAGSITTIYPNVYLFEKFPPQVVDGDYGTNNQRTYFAGTKNWDKYGFAIGGGANELMLKIILPSSGTIYLRPIKLMNWVSPNSSTWWSPRHGGMVGGAVGIFGGIIGCFGGLLGCLAGFGKARKFVLTTTKIFIALGMLLTITGIVAILCKQPYFVWCVFLLPGVILTLIFSLNFPMIQRRYDDLEIRRMASIDVMGS
jgi:hypothetical protein